MPLPANLVRLVELLRRAWPAGRTVAALAGELDVQPWRASELIGRACRLGVPVEQTALAVRCDPSAIPLLADLVELGLGTSRVGRSVVVFARTASTNDVAWQAAARRGSDGLVVMAESQSAGRGRLGRSWADSPGKGLLLSVLLLDEPLADGLANRMMMAAGVAAAEAIEQAVGLSVAIRWPNDLYFHSRKVAGILVESRAARVPPQSPATSCSPRDAEPLSADRVDVVLGIGINCNQAEADFPADLAGRAGSLAIERGEPIDRTALARALLGCLDGWLAGSGGQGGGDGAGNDRRLHAAYLERMDGQARRVRVRHDGRSVEGTVRDVDPSAGLIVELAGGGVAHFSPAQASVEWLAD